MSRLLEAVSILALVSMFLVLAVHGHDVPDQIPSHFDAAGNPDRWTGPYRVYFMPVLGTVVYAVLTWLAKRRTPQVAGLMRAVKAVLLAGFAMMHVQVVMVAVGVAKNPGAWPVWSMLAALAVCAGFYGMRIRAARGAMLGLLLCSVMSAQAKLESAEALAFGPGGILFVGDAAGGAVVAIETKDTAAASASPVSVEQIDQRLATLLGVKRTDVRITDLKVNPVSKSIYISLARGRGPDATPVIVRVLASGAIQTLELDKLKSTRVALPGLPKDTPLRRRTSRTLTITELQYTDGKVIVAGLSNEDFSSTLRVVPYPFTTADRGASIEIFHTAHYAYETNAPVRSMVPYSVGGEQYLLAVYTCTPLVRLRMSDLVDGAQVRGETLAELGRHSSPLDMILYRKGGEDFLLVANTLHGVMKLPLRGIGEYEGVDDTGGDADQVPMEKVRSLKSVVQMDLYDDTRAAMLFELRDRVDLRVMGLP